MRDLQMIEAEQILADIKTRVEGWIDDLDTLTDEERKAESERMIQKLDARGLDIHKALLIHLMGADRHKNLRIQYRIT